jgi:hypothetical protein
MPEVQNTVEETNTLASTARDTEKNLRKSKDNKDKKEEWTQGK